MDYERKLREDLFKVIEKSNPICDFDYWIMLKYLESIKLAGTYFNDDE